MKSSGSSRALLPASGRTALASPLASSASFSSRMSPSSTKKHHRSAANDKSHAAGSIAASSGGHSSSRVASSPSQDGYAYGMDRTMMAAAPTNMGMPPNHEFLYQLQHLQQQQHMQGMVAAAYGYPGSAIPPMTASFAPQYMAPPMLQRATSSSAMTPPMLDDAMRSASSTPHQTTAGSEPNMFAPNAVSTTSDLVQLPTGDEEDATILMQRLDKKDAMINQLGSFLSQMKQESEGTASAWKEKLQEIGELKRQLAATTQQLASTRESEQASASELEQARLEIAAALEAQRTSEQTHIEEITIMHDEITKRQSDAEHVKAGYEQSLRDVSSELLATQQQQQDAAARCRKLEEALESADGGHRAALRHLDDERCELQQSLERMREQVDAADREKQELGQHLWSATQALEQSQLRERELERTCATATSELETAQRAWSERFHGFQSDKAEQLGAAAMLQTQLQELGARLESERAQKEELNAMMVRELQRLNDEAAQREQTAHDALERAHQDAAMSQTQALEQETKCSDVETQLASSIAERDQLRAQLATIDSENQLLQTTGNANASTLQEMNNELRRVLDELEHTQHRYEQLHAVWESHQSGVAKCLQLLATTPAGSASVSVNDTSRAVNSDESSPNAFPARIVAALDEYVQLCSSSAEMKIAVLRAQQELDSDRERFRQREHELQTLSQSLQHELETTRADATALAHELQQLSHASNGNESKLAAQTQQLARELDELRSASGLQVLQLQKSLESQRARTSQLEREKRELLDEAAQLNTTLEAQYSTANAKQLELEQVRATWQTLALEHSDVKENLEDLEERTSRTITELNAKLKELQAQAQSQRAARSALDAEHANALAHVSSLERDCAALVQQLATEQSASAAKERELSAMLEDKTHRMDEMLAVLTQLQAKSEFLEKSRASDDASVRIELEKYQTQLLALAQDKKRLELAYSSLKTQHDQVATEAAALREHTRVATAQQSESDDALTTLQRETARLQGELERATRAKATLQTELHHASDDAQDALRQLEVTRRDARVQEAHWQSELERASKDAEDARAESSDVHALVEELQSKMTSLQSAANATINDLVAELQHAQETLAFDKSRQAKELEALRTQLTAIDDALRRKDQELQALQTTVRVDKEQSAGRENELALRLTRATAALEQKKHESESLSKELEAKTLRVAECERKLAPLAHAKESLQSKTSELKQRLDAVTRDAHALEQRLRDDLTRASKDKREAETLCAAAKDELEAARALTQQQQQQWQSDCRALKMNLERAKSDVARASSESLALAQRLDACQQAANDTIAELSARLGAADQQRETAVSALQRELQLERERRRETEVQKAELQRLVRQKEASSGSNNASTLLPVAAMSERTPAWSSGNNGASPLESTPQQAPPKSAQPTNSALSPPMIAAKMRSQSSSVLTAATAPSSGSSGGGGAPPEIRKFYANEPMTNAELSNLPMALIKAQLGLDLSSSPAAAMTSSSSSSSSPLKSSPLKSTTKGRARSNSALSVTDAYQHQQDNNDDIPHLPLEKLPQNPEADASEVSPSSDRNSSRASRVGGATTAQQHQQLVGISARSSGRLFHLDSTTDGRNRLHAATGAKHSASENNSSSKRTLGGGSSKKKRLPASSSSSSAAASAYASFGTLPSASVGAHHASPASPLKSKSTSKLLPRIP